MPAITFALAALVPAFTDRSEFTDHVALADGRDIACRVVMENRAKLVYRDERALHEVAHSDVRDVRSIERGVAAFLEFASASDATSAGDQVVLARHAASLGLRAEEKNTWLRVLALDATNADAWTALGDDADVRRRRVRIGGEWHALSTLVARGAEADHPLTLSTAHFTVESDLALPRVLDVALAVERVHGAFYALLGPHLELYVFDEAPTIHVWGDTRRMPHPPEPGRTSWFAPLANTFHVQDRANADAHAIVADMTDVLLFNAFRRSVDRKRLGATDGWTRAALAELFASGARERAAHVRFDFAEPYAPHFRLQAVHAGDVTLARLLGAGRGAFHTGTDEAQYTAAAYTLFHFLAFGGGGKHAAALAQYVGESYLGRGGPSRLSALVGGTLPELDAEWNAYVRRIAGS